MKYAQTLQSALYVKRHKRFIVEVENNVGEVLSLHCPNTGSMKNCLYPGGKVWYSDSHNENRKYRCTWEQAEVPVFFSGKKRMARVGVNTGVANSIVGESLLKQQISGLEMYDNVRKEVRFGKEKSRVDFLLTSVHEPDCYVEVKSVTLAQEDGIGGFPDAVTTRGSKHLRELAAVSQEGHRAVLFFCVQHTGINRVKTMDDIDPVYGKTLREVMKQGVEVMAWGVEMTEEDIRLTKPIPVCL